MSIVKMKRLRLVGMQSERDELLKLLQHMGCVEIGDPAGHLADPEWAALTRPDTRALTAAKEAHNSAQTALQLLKAHGAKTGGFLKARPVISEQALFDDGAYTEALELAGHLNDLERRTAALYAEQNKLKAQKIALAPWMDLDIPLETTSTQDVNVVFGTVAGTSDLNKLEGELQNATELAQLLRGGRDTELQYVVLVYHKSAEEAVGEVLKQYGFSRATLRGWTGTAAENDLRLDTLLAGNARQLEETCAAVDAFKDRTAALTRCLDRATQEIAREEARCRLLDTGTAFFLDGWMPASEEKKLADKLERFTCCWESADPAPEEYPEVPVKLKNNAITKPLNMVTEMYSLPAYDGVDPNPLMAPFFILFYGIMMADMGYGLLMMIASVVVLKVSRPKAGMHNFFALLGLCGISTFIMGAITGGFFSDMIPQIIRLFNPESTFVWFWKPLFTPLDDTLMILVGSMCLGFIQIITGMVVSFVKKLRDGQVMDAIWEEGTWWVVFAGAALAILGVTNLVLILGGVMVLVGSGWNAKGFGKVTAVFGSLYNHVTGYFGDILSYSRLMALMLAGSVIAQVFNTLGAIPGNIVLFFIISLLGNALNFALNLLGCFVHDLRLQCLEYFGKFYKDGGKPFRPLEIKTKFVDIE